MGKEKNTLLLLLGPSYAFFSLIIIIPSSTNAFLPRIIRRHHYNDIYPPKKPMNIIPTTVHLLQTEAPASKTVTTISSRVSANVNLHAVKKNFGGNYDRDYRNYSSKLDDDNATGDEWSEISKLWAKTIRKKEKKEPSEKKEKEKDEEMKKEDEQIWLSWLISGKPTKRGKGSDSSSTDRNTRDVIYREAEELGGVMRSDRYASRDWWHNAMNLPFSVILREIRGPVLSLTIWSAAISIVHRLLEIHRPAYKHLITIPPTLHSLMVSALGLLLVFRTNSAYQRFAEGRKIWEKIHSKARDLSRMAKLYEKEIGKEKRRRVQRLLAAFPYLLRHRIRPNLVMRRLNDEEYPRDTKYSILLYADVAALDTDAEAAAIATSEEETGTSRRKTRELYWVDKRTLPWRLLPKGAVEKCARAQNRPLWVCDRMSKELATIPDGPNFTNRERLALLGHVDKLSHCLGACERIHQTVVPLNYARHSLRTLTVWLASLPFALVSQMGLLTGPAVAVISWMLFGVYEIGYSIEDPFQGTLRLSILCDQIRRDVLENEIIMETAFELEIDDSKESEDDEPRDRDEALDYEEDLPTSTQQRNNTTTDIPKNETTTSTLESDDVIAHAKVNGNSK